MTKILRSAIVFIVLLASVGAAAVYLQLRGGTPPSAQSQTAKKEKEKEEGIEMSDAKVSAAGIELSTAGPATLHDSLFLNGTILPNQEMLVQVTPRFPGVVRDVRKRIGDGVNKGDLLAIIESNQSLTAYELKAPIAGTIIERQASLGEYASEQKPAFVVADLSTVWIDFPVYRQDLARVHLADSIVIDLEDGGTAVEGRISYVSPIGSNETQSAIARAVVRNEDTRLRPGLFVTGRLLLSAKPVSIAVKSNALQSIENRPVVFVRSGQRFEARDVEIGARDGQSVEIVFGLLEGDIYAAKNSFVIKSELQKGSSHDND